MRRYAYIGPPELRALIRPGGEGFRLRSAQDLELWAAQVAAEELAEPFTFTVGLDGMLRLAPRRSEHVVCAGGEPVLSAGELRLAHQSDRWRAVEVSNHSTGYCPDPASWPAVAAALTCVGIWPPDGFTHEVVFRRCTSCRQLNIVRDDHYVCVFCDADLTRRWNLG